MSLCLLISYFSVLDLLIYSPSSSSISEMTLSTRFILASSDWMKMMLSGYFGLTLTFLVSLSKSQSSADQSGTWWSCNWVFVGRSLIAYTRYSMNSSADKQSPWHIPIAVLMSSPTFSSNLTFRMTSLRTKCIICSSLSIKMSFKIFISLESLTVSKAFDMSLHVFTCLYIFSIWCRYVCWFGTSLFWTCWYIVLLLVAYQRWLFLLGSS